MPQPMFVDKDIDDLIRQGAQTHILPGESVASIEEAATTQSGQAVEETPAIVEIADSSLEPIAPGCDPKEQAAEPANWQTSRGACEGSSENVFVRGCVRCAHR